MYRNYHSTYREISVVTYNLLIGLILIWGFIINALMVKFATPYFLEMNQLALIIGYFVICIIGMAISAHSDNAFISFIGYNLVVVPVGAILSVSLAGISEATIMHAIVITCIVVTIMTGLGATFPRFFLGMGRTLFVTLCIVCVVEFVSMLLGFYLPSFWDWIIAILFSCYIAYDWCNAQYCDYTINNAVDACVSLYLDIINLFLAILNIDLRRRD